MKKTQVARLLAYVTGMVNEQLRVQNEYLIAENRILRSYLPCRVRLTDAQRATLAAIGRRLGRQLLEHVASVAKPERSEWPVTVYGRSARVPQRVRIWLIAYGLSPSAERFPCRSMRRNAEPSEISAESHPKHPHLFRQDRRPGSLSPGGPDALCTYRPGSEDGDLATSSMTTRNHWTRMCGPAYARERLFPRGIT